MAAHALALVAGLLFGIQSSSMPVAVPKSPGIWSPPRSAPTPRLLPETSPTARDVGGLQVEVLRNIRAARRNGDLTRSEARRLRREAAINYTQGGPTQADLTRIWDSLEALDSIVYASGSAVAPK